MPSLTGRQRRELRALGHHLEPTVHVGAGGVHEAVIAALDRELDAHDLVKIRVGRGTEATEEEIALALAAATGAHVVQILGHTLLLFRPPTAEKKDEGGGSPQQAG